ncbi:Glycerophosphoryl diester phosphodiesterase family-domain-containing protein [Lineolata rhizophorae]|uniref:Glycerophosphoryl diester phosphodiesterase family-domain-containing protein n=1 Tax=Lineolata rhizophorae TaxID=578093 RepID=A0A6A6PB66_9PEZI|nr:Glycerophosphoryl diester phosphodiesterase family-domain-containing protein [Lineolata rhizophorae]
MKFGHNLPRNEVPEWAANYINYKGLKKLIKSAAEVVNRGGSVDLAEFYYSLDRNIEDVDGFYNKKYSEVARRLKLLHDRYGRSINIPEGLDKDEAEDLMGALLELRGQLRKLQWYGEVNRRGFVKITKKLDKKIPALCAQQRYLALKVYPKAFATNTKLSHDMKNINDWLSALGEAKTFDDTGSVHSTASLRTVSSKAVLNVPSSLLDGIEQSIRSDDAPMLTQLLNEANSDEDAVRTSYQKFLLNLLQRSISCRAKNCIKNLLPLIVSLDEEDDLNKRNCIHRLVIAIGRSKIYEAAQQDKQNTTSTLQVPSEPINFLSPAESPVLVPRPCTTTEQESIKLLSKNDGSVRLLSFLLDNLGPEQRAALTARDSYGRLPLHYAAQYGFVAICEVIIKHMQDWGQFDVAEGIDAESWQDLEGFAPLHLSVIGGYPRTTKALLDAENWQGNTDAKQAARKSVSKSGAVLALATKSNFVPIVKLLVEAGVDINYIDERGETALHVAARFGHAECAKALIDGSPTQKAQVDVPEKTFAWTPLFIASVDGHLAVVELLIQAGAELECVDLSGWTPKEHAALRGHMEIWRRLAEVTSPPDAPPAPPEVALARSSSPPSASSIDERRSNNVKEGGTSIRSYESVKTFGHRYLTNETMVLVSLGSMDQRKNVQTVKLDDIPLADAHATQLDTALSVVVSASGASGEATVIDLPVQENISTDPITFMTKDAGKVKLLFDIVPTYAGANDRIVGRGVALLSSVKPSVGSKRISLQGDVSVPIMAANTLDVIGSVNFNFLVITPFQHPNMSITEQHTYWKSITSTMVIGHRGLGKNMSTRKSLQLGENTIQSFIAAANLGAQYVEFDVQLTKDHVPVIYHDFLVSETGIDAPVHTLTLEQFLHMSDSQVPLPRHHQGKAMGAGDAKDTTDTRSEQRRETREARRRRAYSVGASEDDVRGSDRSERMKHTRDFKQKGYKANSRGHFIQAPFTTLEEMFTALPANIGFNVEMKYPMLHESEEHEMDTYAVELNSFVDTVLAKVYDLGQGRNVIFSSFNPDICLLLSFKQPSIPILFLTDAGTCPVGDIRASSLQEAIRFASRWNLLGIVSHAEPLVACPRLVKVVKESGLVCVSYGTLNNDPGNVQRQVKEGIDAVIVDSVLAIRKGLQGSNATLAPAAALQDAADKAAGRVEKVEDAQGGGGEIVSKGSVVEVGNLHEVVGDVNGVPIYKRGSGGVAVNGAVFS